MNSKKSQGSNVRAENCDAERQELSDKLLQEWEKNRQQCEEGEKRNPDKGTSWWYYESPPAKRMQELEKKRQWVKKAPCEEVRHMNARRGGKMRGTNQQSVQQALDDYSQLVDNSNKRSFTNEYELQDYLARLTQAYDELNKQINAYYAGGGDVEVLQQILDRRRSEQQKYEELLESLEETIDIDNLDDPSDLYRWKASEEIHNQTSTDIIKLEVMISHPHEHRDQGIPGVLQDVPLIEWEPKPEPVPGPTPEPKRKKSLATLPEETKLPNISQQAEDSANPAISTGQITFDAEGNDNPKSIYFSRIPQVPSNSSGVTIGRGYDLSEHSSKQVKTDLIKAGISKEIAEEFSTAAVKDCKGKEALTWKEKHSRLEITHEQQQELFRIEYARQEAEVRRVCGTPRVVQKYGKTDWEHLDPAIKEVLVDLKYRGDYRPKTQAFLQPAVVKNDLGMFLEQMKDKNNWAVAGLPIGENLKVNRHQSRIDYLEKALKNRGK